MNEGAALAEDFLRGFHDSRPGGTSAAFAALPFELGGCTFASSYDALLDAVPTCPAPGAVLDLACGDGYLLERLADRAPASVALHGVDLSAGELHAARCRLGGRFDLRLARAQALPYGDGQFDLVLCHMALMLMNALDEVVREMGRVLKPGGRLAAVVGAPSPPSPSRDAFITALRERPVREEWISVRFGDPRMRSAEGAVKALSGCFQDVRVEVMTSVRRLTPAEVWAWYEGAYDLALRSPADETAARTDFLQSAGQHLDADGRMLLPVSLYRIMASR